jgi:hypothetical protein
MILIVLLRWVTHTIISMVFDQLNKTYSRAGIFTHHDLIDWKSVAFALAGLFIVSRALRYYNAKRVSAMQFSWTIDMKPETDLNPFKTMIQCYCVAYRT